VLGSLVCSSGSFVSKAAAASADVDVELLPICDIERTGCVLVAKQKREDVGEIEVGVWVDDLSRFTKNLQRLSGRLVE
jgi:hypothetical protein